MGRLDRLLDRLGPHPTGKGCVYVKRLADLDRAELVELVELVAGPTPPGDPRERPGPMNSRRPRGRPTMDIDLFAGVAVSDLARAIDWFERLLGGVESFDPNDTERVWTLADHRHVYAVLHPEHAGHSLVTLFVTDLDAFVDAAAARGVDPRETETYDNGVRKAVYRDPDGNEIGVGGGPG